MLDYDKFLGEKWCLSQIQDAYLYNKPIHHDMGIEGLDGEGVGSFVESHPLFSNSLTTEHVLFPFLRTEGFFQIVNNGRLMIDADAIAQVAIVVRLCGDKGCLQGIVAICLNLETISCVALFR